jgi:hypothetical protein
LRDLPEQQKMEHRLLVVRAKKQDACGGSSHNGCATIGISRPSQRDMPRDFARYATVEEIQ